MRWSRDFEQKQNPDLGVAIANIDRVAAREFSIREKVLFAGCHKPWRRREQEKIQAIN